MPSYAARGVNRRGVLVVNEAAARVADAQRVATRAEIHRAAYKPDTRLVADAAFQHQHAVKLHRAAAGNQDCRVVFVLVQCAAGYDKHARPRVLDNRGTATDHTGGIQQKPHAALRNNPVIIARRHVHDAIDSGHVHRLLQVGERVNAHGGCGAGVVRVKPGADAAPACVNPDHCLGLLHGDGENLRRRKIVRRLTVVQDSREGGCAAGARRGGVGQVACQRVNRRPGCEGQVAGGRARGQVERKGLAGFIGRARVNVGHERRHSLRARALHSRGRVAGQRETWRVVNRRNINAHFDGRRRGRLAVPGDDKERADSAVGVLRRCPAQLIGRAEHSYAGVHRVVGRAVKQRKRPGNRAFHAESQRVAVHVGFVGCAFKRCKVNREQRVFNRAAQHVHGGQCRGIVDGGNGHVHGNRRCRDQLAVMRDHSKRSQRAVVVLGRRPAQRLARCQDRRAGHHIVKAAAVVVLKCPADNAFNAEVDCGAVHVGCVACAFKRGVSNKEGRVFNPAGNRVDGRQSRRVVDRVDRDREVVLAGIESAVRVGEDKRIGMILGAVVLIADQVGNYVGLRERARVDKRRCAPEQRAVHRRIHHSEHKLVVGVVRVSQ